jgi:hypothetical protein
VQTSLALPEGELTGDGVLMQLFGEPLPLGIRHAYLSQIAYTENVVQSAGRGKLDTNKRKRGVP